MDAPGPSQQVPRQHLQRTLSLSQATLYGLGVTIGAGIYVLVGVASQRAGMSAPLAFLFAAALMAFSAASFAELAGRLPVAAGEAEYVRHGFRSPALATTVGLLVVAIAMVSAAAISVGSSGYIGVFVSLPEKVIIACVVLGMGTIAALRVSEAVSLAGLMTVVEIGGLLLLLGLGVTSPHGPGLDLVTRIPEMAPLTPLAFVGVIAAIPLAVFAFIGFEGLANIAEEVRDPRRTLPRAIFLTLIVATVLYLLVIWLSLTTLSQEQLASSKAPLSSVYEKLTGGSTLTMSAIAIVATLNGIIVQVIMASRVLYGLSAQGSLPPVLASVSPRTSTPVLATALTTAIVLVLALALPLQHLADITSHITLVVFALVNLALIRLKRREAGRRLQGFSVPQWVPWAGFLTCAAVTVSDLARMLLS